VSRRASGVRTCARVTVDSASLGPVGIFAARALLGAGGVVLGSDAPIFDVARAVDDWRLAHPDRGPRAAVCDRRGSEVTP
jgi:hypothetical protein